jgi:hypothetical protein
MQQEAEFVAQARQAPVVAARRQSYSAQCPSGSSVAPLRRAQQPGPEYHLLLFEEESNQERWQQWPGKV